MINKAVTIVLGLSAVCSASAADGKIYFTGEITEPACTSVAQSQSQSLNVRCNRQGAEQGVTLTAHRHHAVLPYQLGSVKMVSVSPQLKQIEIIYN